MNSKKGKVRKSLFLFTKCISLIMVVYLLNSCATVQLCEQYRCMLQQRHANERVIGNVMLHAVRVDLPGVRCDRGLPGQDIIDLVFLAPARHPSEPILDRLLNEAQRRFPNEQIALRDARYVCRGVYSFVADVVTTEPMPQAVAHSEIITVTEGQIGNIIASDGSVLGQISFAQVTRGDLYRRAHNWLTDTARNVAIQTADLGLGRIIGRYSFTVTTGGDIYLISSTFTIDIHDARAQIQFEEAVLQRPFDSVLPIIVGNFTRERDHTVFEGRTFVRDNEPIFLQSIANLAQVELACFTNALISRITSPDW